MLADRGEQGQILSGQAMHLLVRSGVAERVGDTSGRQSRYRLTEAGRQTAAWIEWMRPSPSREQLDTRISARRARRVSMWREAMRKTKLAAEALAPAGAQSPAQARIVRALAAGPLATADLRLHIADLSRHPNSIYLMLSTLAARGAIREVGSRRCGKVWMLSDGAQ
jgi:DNA-binding PadR family transcriptional regulator